MILLYNYLSILCFKLCFSNINKVKLINYYLFYWKNKNLWLNKFIK